VIYTIGHSTHSSQEFLGILEAHRIEQVADVRTLPHSKRHPHFSRDQLDTFLERHRIVYRHFPSLGGLRKPLRDSVNSAWQHPGFRGYADYMQSARFERGLEDLLTFAQQRRTTVMCAEAVWWRCHRRLLSDALLVRGVPVRHIISTACPKPHELSPFARVTDRKVIYPGLL
jgi:uncharacterized protein (DUF488 family)